jgi:DNA polymerase III alpha subunit (gram-positive type)
VISNRIINEVKGINRVVYDITSKPLQRSSGNDVVVRSSSPSFRFSLLDGACDHDTIAQTAAKYKMPAVAVTDHGNLFGAIGFYEAAKKAGVKPIIGCEMYVAKTNRLDRDPASGRPNHLIVLCENEKGYPESREARIQGLPGRLLLQAASR